MKKYLYFALALPLMYACSSEDIEEKIVSNDPFPGIEKVDATFSMDEQTTRFDGGVWTTEEGDKWGFAWMGDGTVLATNTGNAYQNHNLIQTDGIFKPQTSIYVGKYYLYRPYDKTTVSPQAINFNSLVDQPLAEGYASTTQAWKDLAKTAINIGDVWTDVSVGGTTFGTDPTIWNKAGVKGANPEKYKIYAAMFSNQTGLDLTYVKNNPTFAAAQRIQGATDIDFTIAAGDAVGAADIYEATVDLDGSAKSFTYAPKASPNGVETNHSGTYWANKSNLQAAEGFTWTDDVITLTPADAVNGLSTGDNGSKGWFWFNSLPVTDGGGALGTAVQAVFTSSYGVVTVNSTVGACASVFEKYNPADANPQWIKLAAADNATTTPKEWNLAGAHNTFVNQYGNHKGKYALTVDFSAGVMDDMHIKNDTHLQKLLKYYLASGKTENVSLNLDGASPTDKTFKISKISIALIQTLQAAGKNVKVHACTTHNNPVKIIVTQDGSDGKTEVPELDDVFDAATDVYLASNTNWTWKERTGTNQLTVDANVASLTNEGNLTVNASNIQLSVAGKTITNAAGATMNIANTNPTTVKTALKNFGTINVGAADNTSAELRAYNATVTNDASALNVSGTINNYGVVGKSAGTTGVVNNYGYIKMMNNDAITLLTSNETGGANFAAAWAGGNKMGTVELPNGNATALVSVSNATDQGFIKYNWTASTYATPAGNVKYNTIVVNGDITFNAVENEIQYIEFNGTRTQFINPAAGNLPFLKGIILNAGKSIIIEKSNVLACGVGAYLAPGATVYRGGTFTYVSTTNYFGNWSLDQIVEY